MTDDAGDSGERETPEQSTQTDLSPWESPHDDADSENSDASTAREDSEESNADSQRQNTEADSSTEDTDSETATDTTDIEAGGVEGWSASGGVEARSTPSTGSSSQHGEGSGEDDVRGTGGADSDAVTESTDQNDDSEDEEQTDSTTKLAGLDWERRSLGDSYPADANYYCNECNDFHSNSIRELKTHVREDEDIGWGEYLKQSQLHHCAGCGEGLSSLQDLYCEDCTQSPSDRIPCRNCGEVRVKVTDPFCSAGCAGERIEATDGPPSPLDPPQNPSDSWLDHPHRLHNGIPAGAPFIANHQLACRDCFEYGADDLHKFAVHVSEKHEHGWGGYIQTHALRRCRICETPLDSLLPLYCSQDCQLSDPDPLKTCARDGCDAAVERRQTYCSHDCYLHTAP